MKKLLTLSCILFSVISFSQEFSGKATYKTNRKTNIKLDSTQTDGNTGLQKKIQASLAKMFQKTFILNFTKNESIYKEEEQLSSPATGMEGVMSMVIGSGGVNDRYYKNIKENRFVNKTEIMSKRFLIKDTMPKIDWKLSGETKNIGTYTCYKATWSREEERIGFHSANEKSKKPKKKVTIVTTAWYTLQIPVSNGPRNFGGLPGLILEVNDGEETIVCTEVILSGKDKIIITEPVKGKVVTEAEYTKIKDEKSKEMMERFRSKRGNGETIEIKIGG